MTTPQPTSPPPSSTKTLGFLTWWSTVPRWAFIAIIAAILIAGYYFYTHFYGKTSSAKTSKTWASQANSYLSSQGYPADTSHEAIHNYVSGQALTPSQIVLVASAIGALGSAPGITNTSQQDAQLASAPSSGTGILGGGAGSIGSGSESTTLPGSPYPGDPATAVTTTATNFWNVTVGAAGWSTTWQGIAQQFGTTAAAVQAANPGINIPQSYAKIPQGDTVKVPRS